MIILAKLRPRQHPRYVYNREYKHVPALRILSSFMLMTLLVMAGGTAFFVYYRVINTIGQMQSIVILQSELGVDPINFERLEKVQAAWEKKHATTTLLIARDPFQLAPATEATSSQRVN